MYDFQNCYYMVCCMAESEKAAKFSFGVSQAQMVMSLVRDFVPNMP